MSEQAMCTDCRSRPADGQPGGLCEDCRRDGPSEQATPCRCDDPDARRYALPGATEPTCWRCFTVALGGDGSTPEPAGDDPIGEVDADDDGGSIVSVIAADVKPANVRWAWQGWIPLGMYSTLVGMPGFGKTTLAMQIAAQITRGELDGDLAGRPSTVLFISYEDVIEVRLRPMAEAHQADLSRLVFLKAKTIGDQIDLTSQLGKIEAKVIQHDARMVIIDPLVAGLPNGKVDSHRDQSVRSVLAPLMTLAEQHDIALFATHHFGKGAMSALMGTGGSIAFVGAPRSILAFGPDPREGAAPHARVLAHVKSNVAQLQDSRDVSVIVTSIADGEVVTTRAVLGDENDVHADDLVQVNHREESPVIRAEKFLRDLLADGPHRSQEVFDLAEDNGISVRTLKRAKRDLDVDSVRKVDSGGKACWWWMLSDDDGSEADQ